MKRIFALIVVSLFISACQNDNLDENTTQSTPQDGSLWFGEVDSADGDRVEMAAVFAPDARYIHVALEPVEAAAGSVTFDGGLFSSEALSYFQYHAMEFFGSLTGEITNGTMEGKASVSGLELAFSASMLPDLENYAGLQNIAGNYADDSVAFAIDEDGLLTGSDGAGCVWSGELGVFDESLPIYTLSVVKENCTLSPNEGTFTGIIAYGVFPFAGNDQEGVVFVAHNPVFAIRGHLLNQ